MSNKLFKQAAIHEAGHIIIAHKFSCRINSTSIDVLTPGEGKTSISWNEHQEVINILTNPVLASERSRLMNMDMDKGYFIGLASCFIMVMCAGTAAEVLYEEHANGSSRISQLNGLDNDMIADFIDVLQTIGVVLEDTAVEYNFSAVKGLLSKENIWTAVNDLSEMIIDNPKHHLSGIEITSFLSSVSLE